MTCHATKLQQPAAGLADNPLPPLAVTAVAHALFLLLALAHNDYDPSVFIAAGDRVCNRHDLPANVRLMHDSEGYDGEFYYRIALHPATAREYEYGVKLDAPVHRHERILYPLLVWLLSFGDASRVPWTMVAVNYAALCWLSVAGAGYARRTGRHAMWGAAFAFYPGLLLSLARDLTEVLSTTFVVEAMLAIRSGSRWRASALLSCAILTRETCVVLVVAALAAMLVSRPRQNDGNWPIICLPPLMAYVIWQLAIRWWWSSAPHLTGSRALTVPFYGYLSALAESLADPAGAEKYAELIYLGLSGAVAANVLKKTRARLWEKAPLVAYLALAACLNNVFWEDDWGFLRIHCDAYVLGLIILLQSNSRLAQAATALSFALWLHLFCTRF